MKSIAICSLLIVVSIAFPACKKNFTCTCTTTVSSVSTTKVYDLPHQYPHDANRACDRFETDANNSGIGTTNCHL